MSTLLTLPGIFGEAKSPLRFYDNLLKKNTYRSHCRDVCEYKLLTPNDYLLPFTIARGYKNSAVTNFIIKDEDGNTVYDLSNGLIEVKEFLTDSLLVYKGDTIGQILPCGTYYAEITDGQNTFYSEDFYVVPLNLSEDAFVPGDVPGTIPENLCLDGSQPAESYLQQLLNAVTNYYQISFDISDYEEGSMTVEFGLSGDIVEVLNYTTGRVEIIGNNQGVGATWLTFSFSDGFIGCIDNIMVQPLLLTYEECFHRLRWQNSCSMIGNLYYRDVTNKYYNEILIEKETEIKDLKPAYVIEESFNGDRDPVAQWARVENTYEMELGMLPLYLVDSLSQIRLHDTITLILANDLGQSVLKEVVPEIKWESDGVGCFAAVNLNFQLPDASINSGCCETVGENCEETICDPEFDDFILVNDDFENLSQTLENQWEFNGAGKLCFNDGVVGDEAEFNLDLEAGSRSYQINITNYTGTVGCIEVEMYGSVLGEITATGASSFIATGSGDTQIIFRSTDGGIACFDVSVSKFDVCWNLEHMIPIAGGGIEYDESTSDIEISSDSWSVDPYHTYVLVIVIDVLTGMDLDLVLEGYGVIETFTAAGTYEVNINPEDYSVTGVQSLSLVATGLDGESTLSIASINMDSCAIEV